MMAYSSDRGDGAYKKWNSHQDELRKRKRQLHLAREEHLRRRQMEVHKAQSKVDQILQLALGSKSRFSIEGYQKSLAEEMETRKKMYLAKLGEPLCSPELWSLDEAKTDDTATDRREDTKRGLIGLSQSIAGFSGAASFGGVGSYRYTDSETGDEPPLKKSLPNAPYGKGQFSSSRDYEREEFDDDAVGDDRDREMKDQKTLLSFRSAAALKYLQRRRRELFLLNQKRRQLERAECKFSQSSSVDSPVTKLENDQAGPLFTQRHREQLQQRKYIAEKQAYQRQIMQRQHELQLQERSHSGNDNFSPDWVKSYNIFESYVRIDPETGETDASRIFSNECFNEWLNGRRGQLKHSFESFRRALMSHVTGHDRRKPFRPEVEAAILKIVRRNEVWECFRGKSENGKFCKIGLYGFRGQGYWEAERNLGQSRPQYCVEEQQMQQQELQQQEPQQQEPQQEQQLQDGSEEQ